MENSNLTDIRDYSGPFRRWIPPNEYKQMVNASVPATAYWQGGIHHLVNHLGLGKDISAVIATMTMAQGRKHFKSYNRDVGATIGLADDKFSRKWKHTRELQQKTGSYLIWYKPGDFIKDKNGKVVGCEPGDFDISPLLEVLDEIRRILLSNPRANQDPINAMHRAIEAACYKVLNFAEEPYKRKRKDSAETCVKRAKGYIEKIPFGELRDEDRRELLKLLDQHAKPKSETPSIITPKPSKLQDSPFGNHIREAFRGEITDEEIDLVARRLPDVITEILREIRQKTLQSAA